MKFLNQIRSVLNTYWPDGFSKYRVVRNSISQEIYSKPVHNNPTLLVVVNPMGQYNLVARRYFKKFGTPVLVYLYDLETNMVFGKINEVFFGDDFENKLFHAIDSTEGALFENVCPKCDFWLVQRKSKTDHKFMGCSGYPDCTYTANFK